MTKDDILGQLAELGVTAEESKVAGVDKLSGDETKAELEAVLEKAQAVADAPKEPVAPAKAAPAREDFSWAVNVVKLNRAIAHIQHTKPELKGKELEAAVKGRYITLKGLLKSEEAARVARHGKRANVQNMADDDGSNDDE